MTFFASQVETLMDHLGIDQAVVGGTSLGANTTLELNHMSPERVKAMMIEMPVLDNALLAAAVIFTPIMIGLRIGEPLLRRLAAVAVEFHGPTRCSTWAWTSGVRIRRPPRLFSRASSSAHRRPTTSFGSR